MATHRFLSPKALAINIAFAVTGVISGAVVLHQGLAAGRVNDLMEKSHNAFAAGNFEAFEGYRESAYILLQTNQSQQPWIHAAYIGLGVVLVAVWSRYITKIRAA